MNKIISLERVENNHSFVKECYLEHHYLKRKPTAMITFLIKENDRNVGVITYGLPSAPLTKKFGNKILELQRLFLFDNVDTKYVETQVISKSFKLLKQMKNNGEINYEWVISFAQLDANHIGTIYQASNWIYTGLTKKQSDYKIKGFENKHPRGILKGKTVKEIKEIYGDKFYTAPRPRKARYFYPLFKMEKGKKKLKEIGYDILPYQKMNDKEIIDILNE